ncbi:MAG: DUF692 domain-containing protein [Pseudomonadota bacterium]
MTFATSPAIGAGFKPAHFDALLREPASAAHAAEGMAAVDFFEIHAENHLGDGGAPQRRLRELAERWPLTVHGVGLSLGGAARPDRTHIARIRRLLERHPAMIFSEHLAWSSHGSVCLPDLLPVAYDETSLARIVSHVQEVQETLGRAILIENPSTYLPWADPDAETGFLADLAAHSGCGLLLDLNNVVVSCRNHERSPQRYLQRFPLHAVGQFHLAGHRVETIEDGRMLRIDDHASPVGDEALSLYATALRTTGPRPTLIEWDHDVPTWPVLRDELWRVRAVATTALDAARAEAVPA